MKPKKTTPVPRARSQTTRSQTAMRTGGARGAATPDPLFALRDQLGELQTRVESLERSAGLRGGPSGDGGSPK